VHQFGLPADLDGLGRVADRHGCARLEDAACAIGSEYRDRRIGSHGSPACFSFHPRKIVTTGEGGMIVTDDPDFADRVRRLRSHGRDLADWHRHQEGIQRRESYGEIGYNYRMSDIEAAVGIAQMERIDSILAIRRRLGDAYDIALRDHPYLTVSRWPYDAKPNRQSYAVLLTDEAPIERAALVTALRDHGIAAMPGLACIHREPCYESLPRRVDLSRSEALSQRMVLLPMFADLSAAQHRQVVCGTYEAFGLPAP